MSVSEILQYLRLNVNVQTPGGIIDPAYLSMTDDELTLYLKLALAQPYFVEQGIDDLTDITERSVYALVLFAKRELYAALAVRVAKDVSMSADSVSMSQSERYNHYADLMRQCDAEIAELTSGADAALGGTGGTAYTYTYGTPNRPKDKGRGKPNVTKLKATAITETSVTLTWTYPNAFPFTRADVYVSLTPIIIINGFDTEISITAAKEGSTTKPDKTEFVAAQLSPDTPYHFAVVAYDTYGNIPS